MSNFLARMHHVILTNMVRDGRAPHYAELASELGISLDQAREALHELPDRVRGVWLHPGTDLIASYAPFSNIPTHYLISVEGQQKWYGQ